MTSGFDLLEQQFAPHLIGDRTGSTAMLAWFLTNAWREEADEVESALCDGSNDKGIDAIVADSDAREITIFQAKRRQTAGRTQGDSDLQRFRGIAPYFRGPEGIDDLLAASPNRELALLVNRLDLRGLLDDQEASWSVSFVFVTNAELDASATSYLATTRDELPRLTVWERDQLVPIARRTERPGLLDVNFTLTPNSDVLVASLEDDVEMAVALARIPKQ